MYRAFKTFIKIFQRKIMHFKKLMNFTDNIVLYNNFTNVYRSIKGFLKMVIDHEKFWQQFMISSLLVYII